MRLSIKLFGNIAILVAFLASTPLIARAENTAHPQRPALSAEKKARIQKAQQRMRTPNTKMQKVIGTQANERNRKMASRPPMPKSPHRRGGKSSRTGAPQN